MITEFKIFENLNEGEPKIGDYVICKTDFQDISHHQKINNFLKSSIGHIIGINKLNSNGEYIIKYENIPKELKKYYFNVYFSIEMEYLYYTIKQIEYWSENKEDLEYIIDANKYNL